MKHRSARSKILTAVIIVIIVALAGCGPPPEYEEEPEGSIAVTSADAAWWRGLTQAERNQVILDRAARDTDRYVNQECKEWVRTVVLDASRGSVNVPPTCPTATGWYWCSGAGTVGLSVNIRNVQPGWIVQMRRRHASGTYGPHTAIVVGRSSYGVAWIDSNFYESTQPRVVKVHYESFADFDRATCVNGWCYYSVYYIGGN